jgi:DNA topoisomerase-1
MQRTAKNGATPASPIAPPDPLQSAKDAGLRYVTDAKPGLTRKRHGRSFRYFDTEGKPLKDVATLARIRSLVIPPAWKDVWICPSSNGHLQATGRDASRRKQSRYHPRWREVRDETKYERMLSFGAMLPGVRQRVEHDISQSGLSQTKVLATIVRLMETTCIRVGNTEYARKNHSYGLTTMRNRHVRVDGADITFRFEGKSGVEHTVDVHDRRLAKIIQRCQDIPGYELFQYVDDAGERHTIDSSDVNTYLREISGQDFTAKDFRTWAGSVAACALLRELEPFASPTQAKKNLVGVIKDVASQLGNTPSVCRKCYVHPAVLDIYLNGGMEAAFRRKMGRGNSKSSKSLQKEERALMHLLELSVRPAKHRQQTASYSSRSALS